MNIQHDTESFLDFYQSIINEDKLRKKFRIAKTKQHYLDKLRVFSSHLAFSDNNHSFMKDYELWLLKRDNSKNTIASNLRCIISIMNVVVRNVIVKENVAREYKLETGNVSHYDITKTHINFIRTEFLVEQTMKNYKNE